MTIQTCTVEKFSFAVRARLNSGADMKTSIYGAIRECGPLRSCRVSSAQAKGAAKKYAYWGAVRYAVRITRDGRLSNCALERASSDRRSNSKAYDDLIEMAASTDRAIIGRIGTLSVAEIEQQLTLGSWD